MCHRNSTEMEKKKKKEMLVFVPKGEKISESVSFSTGFVKVSFILLGFYIEQVAISWACLLILGSLKLLQGSTFLSSWKGLTFSATGLAIVTVLMQILIRFSQSERSTPAKVVPTKANTSGGPLDPRQQPRQN